MLKIFLNRTAGMISKARKQSVVFISSYVFVLSAGLLLGHWHQPKGGCLAHTAKEEAAVWRAGESADRNSANSQKNTFSSICCFSAKASVFVSLWFSFLSCLWLCASASVSFPIALLSLPLYPTVSLPHANTHTQTQLEFISRLYVTASPCCFASLSWSGLLINKLCPRQPLHTLHSVLIFFNKHQLMQSFARWLFRAGAFVFNYGWVSSSLTYSWTGFSELLRLTWPWGILIQWALVSLFPTMWLSRGYKERWIVLRWQDTFMYTC